MKTPIDQSFSAEITKDNETHGTIEGFNEEEYDLGPGGRGRFDPRALPPRSHQERGRPPPPPHQHRPLPRDAREPREGRDPRDPHYREGRDPRDLPRDRRDPHMREPHPPRDPREQRAMRDRYEGEGGHHRGGEYVREYGRGEGRGRGGTGPGGDQHTRIFVALFDYDPPTMSPNPDACDEELGFREGQLIKVYGDKDPDGFYWGEAGGHSGYVPCNMVSEVQVSCSRLLSSYVTHVMTWTFNPSFSILCPRCYHIFLIITIDQFCNYLIFRSVHSEHTKWKSMNVHSKSYIHCSYLNQSSTTYYQRMP